MADSSVCRVCGNESGNTRHVLRERMYGSDEAFEYSECAACHGLQIVEIPDDLGRYYPSNYYSFRELDVIRPAGIKRVFKRIRLDHSLTGDGVLGRAMSKLFGPAEVPGWAEHAGLGADSSILDVGCGRGHLLHFLSYVGFTNLTGVDPFVDATAEYDNGVRVIKAEVGELDQQFDFVMLHHSIEHVPDPLATLRAVHEVTADGRLALVRTPVANTYAWHHYGVDWFALEPPRHLFIFSVEGVKILAEKAGFVVEDVRFDAISQLFWASEQAARGIAHTDNRSYFKNPDASMFSKAEIDEFERRARELNEAGQGDQACFYLRKRNRRPA